MTEQESISIKDLIELKFNNLEKLTEERSRLVEKALDLQAGKYEQHFISLNNEYKRIDSIQDKQVSRESYDLQHAKVCEDINEIKQWRAVQESKASQSSVNKVMIVSILGIAFSLLNLALRLMGK